MGRENEEWLNILIWGHQITLQLLPDQILPRNKQGKRHFGVILPREKFAQPVENIEPGGKVFIKDRRLPISE